MSLEFDEFDGTYESSEIKQCEKCGKEIKGIMVQDIKWWKKKNYCSIKCMKDFKKENSK